MIGLWFVTTIGSVFFTLNGQNSEIVTFQWFFNTIDREYWDFHIIRQIRHQNMVFM